MTIASNVQRLSRLISPNYAARINAQIVYPAQSIIIKPNELESALARPRHVARYKPEKPPEYYAAQISYGVIMGHPFMDGNKRTAFFLADAYLRAQGLPGLTNNLEDRDALYTLAEQYIKVAKGDIDADGLASGSY